MTPRLLPCGPAAMMVEVDDVEQASMLASFLRARAPRGVVELVPAARTVLVVGEGPEVVAAVERLVASFVPDLSVGADGDLIEVPTVYDGIDLAHVAATTGQSIRDVIELHSSTEYRAAFCGFAPGFAYLTGLASELQLPRRASPRPRIAAGSVAIGAEFTGVYPTNSPGGWHLLGRTDVETWDPSRQRPALIVPGDRVRFVPVPA